MPIPYHSHKFRFLISQAEYKLKDWGVPVHLHGFNYLAEAAVIKCFSPCLRVSHVYSLIASPHGISVKTVSNSISYALTRNRFRICSNMKLKLNELYASRVICILALYLNESFIVSHDLSI